MGVRGKEVSGATLHFAGADELRAVYGLWRCLELDGQAIAA
jgi:hypothetical protein